MTIDQWQLLFAIMVKKFGNGHITIRNEDYQAFQKDVADGNTVLYAAGDHGTYSFRLLTREEAEQTRRYPRSGMTQ